MRLKVGWEVAVNVGLRLAARSAALQSAPNERRRGTRESRMRQLHNPRSTVRSAVALSLVLTVATGLMACSSSGSSTVGKIEKYLVADVPSEFTQQDDDLAGTGPTDLAKAANDAGFSGAATFLQQAGFVAEYQRLWTTNDFRSTIYVRLAQFSAQAGAASYCAKLAELLRDKVATPTSFSVDAMTGAIGVRASDRDGSASAVFAAKGRWCVEALWGGTNELPAEEQIAKATSLFRQQYDKL